MMMKAALAVLLAAGGARAAGSAKLPRAAESHFFGPVRFFTPEGAPRGESVSLARRVLDPGRGVIEETVVQPARGPGNPAREFTVVLTRGEEPSVFRVAEQSGAFSGKMTLEGPEWAWTSWRVGVAMPGKGRVAGAVRLDAAGLHGRKRIFDAANKHVLTTQEELSPISAEEYARRRRELLGEGAAR